MDIKIKIDIKERSFSTLNKNAKPVKPKIKKELMEIKQFLMPKIGVKKPKLKTKSIDYVKRKKIISEKYSLGKKNSSIDF